MQVEGNTFEPAVSTEEPIINAFEFGAIPKVVLQRHRYRVEYKEQGHGVELAIAAVGEAEEVDVLSR